MYSIFQNTYTIYEYFSTVYRLDKFQEDVIIAHNKFRGKHHAAPLKWSAGLAEGARQWATALSEKGNLKHSNQPFVGENIWIGKGKNITPMLEIPRVDNWYKLFSLAEISMRANSVKHYIEQHGFDCSSKIIYTNKSFQVAKNPKHKKKYRLNGLFIRSVSNRCPKFLIVGNVLTICDYTKVKRYILHYEYKKFINWALPQHVSEVKCTTAVRALI